MPVSNTLNKRKINFLLAIKNSDLPTLSQLWTECPPVNHPDLLVAKRYKAFRTACAIGDLTVIQWLWEQASNLINPIIMLEIDDCDAFCSACATGQLDTIRWLWEKISPEKQLRALQTAFRYACAAGHKPTVEWLWEQYSLLSDPVELLQANDYDAFCLACTQGHSAIAELLWAWCPAQDHLKMLKANRYEAFCGACTQGHELIVGWLWALCPPEHHAAMLQAKGYACIKKMLSKGQKEVFDFLWSSPWIRKRVHGWWGDIFITLELTKEPPDQKCLEIIAELFSEPAIVRQLEKNNILRDYMPYFEPEKQVYFKEIRAIQDAKESFESDLRDNGLNLHPDDIESAMRADLAKKAMAIRDQVFSNTKVLFESYGETDAIRLACIEKQIRQLILVDIDADASGDIKNYARRHQRALLMGDEQIVHALTQLILVSPEANQKTAYIAWRAFDVLAQTVEWPNLTTLPKAEDLEKECFSTKETYEDGVLHLREACDLVRQQVAHYFLACKDGEFTRAAFFRYLSEIRRAHNDTEQGTDSPSCYPGIVTRLAQAVRAHPSYQAFFDPGNHFIPIEDLFYRKLSSVFMTQCRTFDEEEEQYHHYDALAAIRPSECVKILSDSYCASLGEVNISAWLAHRKQLKIALLEGYKSPVHFIERLLAQLKAEERIQDIWPIDYSWATYLLESLAASDATLSKLFYQFQFLLKKPEESVSEPTVAAPAIVMHYALSQMAEAVQSEAVARPGSPRTYTATP